MKKLLVFSIATLLLTTTNNAQTREASIKKDSLNRKEAAIKKEKKYERKELRKLEGKAVSYLAKNQFANDFGNIPVNKWERATNFDEATFSKDGQVMMAFYDYNAKLVGTTSQKTFANIPANAQKFIDTKYKGYSKESVLLFNDVELNTTDMILFGTQFADADNYFVELKKDNTKIIIRVNMSGDVSFFKQLK